MIHYKFEPSDQKVFCEVQRYFNHHFKFDWIDSEPFAKLLIDKIDNSDYLGGGIMRNREFDQMYNFTGLCGSTKNIILQKYFPQFWYKATGIGENLYPLLDQCPWDLHFIGRTNFFAWGNLKGYPLTAEIYLDDFDITVDNKYAFDDYLRQWGK